MGLTPRLILCIVVVTAVPVILISFFAFHIGSEGVRRHIRLHLTSVVTVKTQEVERWFRPLEASADVLANSSQIKQWVGVVQVAERGNESRVARESLLRHFKDVLQRNIGLQRISVTSANQSSLLVSTKIDAPFTPVAVPLSDNTTSGVRVYLPPYIPGGEMSPAIITAPVVKEGEVQAHIVLEASPVSLYETLSPDVGLGTHGKVYLVNRDGEVLTPPRHLPSGSKVIQATGLITEAANGFGSGLRYKDFMGTEVVGAYKPLESLGWGVAVEMPASEAFSDINQMRWVIIGASGAFLLLILMAALLITRHIIRPLHTLIEGAQVVGRGDLAHRIEVRSADEIGMLAQSFNQMAVDLKATIENRLAERRRAEIELERKNRELEEASLAKTQILATASHELKTPLTGIIGYVDRMLLRQDTVGLLNERQQRYLETVQESSLRLKALIDDLLEVSRIESNSLELTLVELDVRREVQHIVSSMHTQTSEKDIDVVLAILPDISPVRADRLRFSQVIGNLLSNACKYSPTETTVTISAKEAGGFVQIDVSDTGMGISKADQSQLFSKFFRSDHARNMEIPGTGLGLFITKHIVEAHQGKIWVSSEEGKGTTFSFTLPRA